MSVRKAAGSLAMAVAALTAGACSEATPTEAFSEDVQFSHAHGASSAEIGTTAGWYKGEIVTFLYNQAFDCVTPPSSLASSGCVLGDDAHSPPRGGNDPVLYVLTPLFAPTRDLNLHCPTSECINHPGDIDVTPVKAVLESVLGPLPSVIPLPAHSHVVDVSRGGWWKVEVNGVLTQEAWDAIAAAKSLDAVRVQQSAGTVTGDIDTNMFLFFNVMRRDNSRGGPFRSN
jgi:hypothetical protein